MIAPFYSQHVKWFETLVKSPWEYFYQIILSRWEKPTWKTSLLMIFELLQLFVKTLTADDKCSLCNISNLQELIQMQLSKKLKTFCQFFSRVLKSASNFKSFGKRDYSHSISDVSPNLWTVKDIVRQMFK